MIEPGGFKTQLTDLQQSLERAKQAWDEAPMHIKKSYGQHYFDTCIFPLRERVYGCIRREGGG